MHTTTAAALFLQVATLVSLAHAEELKANDVPAACKQICGPMVTLTNTCDVNPDPESTRRRRLGRRANDDNTKNKDESDEAVEAQCICNNTSFDVRSIAALCAACISQSGKPSEDMDTIMAQCSFASTTFAPGATTAVAGITVKATKLAFTAASSSTSTSTPTGSSMKNSAGVVTFDLGAMRLGLAAIGVAVFLLF